MAKKTRAHPPDEAVRRAVGRRVARPAREDAHGAGREIVPEDPYAEPPDEPAAESAATLHVAEAEPVEAPGASDEGPASGPPDGAPRNEGPVAEAGAEGGEARKESDQATAPTPEAPAAAKAVPEPPPEPPADDPRIVALQEEVARLRSSIQERPADEPVDNRMRELLNLAEILSVRYNPFLETSEQDIFDGTRLNPKDLVPGEASAVPEEPSAKWRPPAPERHRPAADEAQQPENEGALEHPRHEVVRPGMDVPEPAEASAAQAGSGRDPVNAEVPQPTRDTPSPAQEEAATAQATGSAEQPIGSSAPAAAPGERGEAPTTSESILARPQRPAPTSPQAAQHTMRATTRYPLHAPPLPTGSRETYLVLWWFEQLIADAKPAALHWFLDHYHRLGWISDDAYDWLRTLAGGVCEPELEARMEDLGLDAKRVLRLHRVNLRFLDGLFRTGMDTEDPRRLQERVEAILREED